MRHTRACAGPELDPKIKISELPKDAPEEVIEAAVQACMDAFEGDRVVATSFVGGYDGHLKQPSLLPALGRALVKAGIVGGRVFIARYNDNTEGEGGGDSIDSNKTIQDIQKGIIVGTAVWFPPGTSFLDSNEQKDAGWNDFWAQLGNLDEKTKDWWNYFFTVPPVFGKEERNRTWWLNWLGVRKDYQGHGVGSALLARGHQEALADKDAKEENLRLCLNTHSLENVEFYKYNGFIMQGLVQLHGPKEYGEEKFTLYSCLKKLRRVEEGGKKEGEEEEKHD